MGDLYTGYAEMERGLVETGAKRWMIICGQSVKKLPIYDQLNHISSRHTIDTYYFNDFSPNPSSVSVENGIAFLKQCDCDAILAIGGGSAMDVAKCIRHFAHVDARPLTLKEEGNPAAIPFYAIPTTAGSGSEATRFAVIYVNGNKTSVDDARLLPDAVLLDPSLLATLPEYQKKATMFDALCHATESIWSMNANEESERYAGAAIGAILPNAQRYLAGDMTAAGAMLKAAYDAGRAINITRTTAGHAMAYKLTTTYGFAHGHAVALCISVLWSNMLETKDPILKHKLLKLAKAYGEDDPRQAFECFRELKDQMNWPKLPDLSDEEYRFLASAVDPQRLANHPEKLTTEMISHFYRQIKA